MNSMWVVLAYGGAAILAFVLLYFFEPTRWAWHVLALAIAVALALVQLPSQFTTPVGTLALGGVILFLFLWGIGFPAFRRFHHHRAH